MLIPSSSKIAVFVVDLEGEVGDVLKKTDGGDYSAGTRADDNHADGTGRVDGVVFEFEGRCFC